MNFKNSRKANVFFVSVFCMSLSMSAHAGKKKQEVYQATEEEAELSDRKPISATALIQSNVPDEKNFSNRSKKGKPISHDKNTKKIVHVQESLEAKIRELETKMKEMQQQFTPNQISSNGLKKGLEAFDPVPADQVDPIVKRLKLVDRLIREHGRAYDYRIHTVRELEQILSALEKDPIALKTPPLQLEKSEGASTEEIPPTTEINDSAEPEAPLPKIAEPEV